jgi:hypothetical protein
MGGRPDALCSILAPFHRRPSVDEGTLAYGSD